MKTRTLRTAVTLITCSAIQFAAAEDTRVIDSQAEWYTGYGFQFELRMTVTTENKSKPMLDKLTLQFE